MRKSIMLVLGLVATLGVFAQDRFFTKSGKISFYSKATLENIEAHNRSVTGVLDTKTGNVQFAVPMKGFEFQKALMQEHFNENYLETSKYSKGEFKGQITNNSEVDYTKEGTYDVTVKGQMMIHGETKDLETPGKVTVKGGKVQVESDFNISLTDYKIKNDKMNNISNTIRVTVNCTMDPVK